MLGYLDCFSGISGDMLLGALVDAGVDGGALRAGLASLPLDGFRLEVERVASHGLTGTRAVVVIENGAAPVERHLAEIEEIIAAGALPDRARARALAIFRRLAEAEARVHGTPVEAVHFHEVGAVDAIVDVVGSALGLELLEIDELYCSELPLTSGRVRGAHGVLPVPAPATLELLRGSGAAWRPVDAEGELITPTGAAVVAALARFERPATRVDGVGYGFGRRELPWANCLRLVVGEATRAREVAPGNWERDTVTVLEANVDNMTGEALGWLMERLLGSGALDVAFAPLQMKKQRPGTLLMVIAEPERAEELAGVVLRESGTLGVRMAEMSRLKAGRRVERIATPLGEARVKARLEGERIIGVAAEYEDARALAERHGLGLGEVVTRIEAAGRARYGLGNGEVRDSAGRRSLTKRAQRTQTEEEK